MALTEDQRASVRLYLGYPARWFQLDSALEQAMSALDSVGSSETLVVGLLSSLADIDAKLLASHTNLQASRAEDVELFGPIQVATLRAEGSRFVGRLASVLGVEVRHNPFAGRGGSGDNYAPQG